MLDLPDLVDWIVFVHYLTEGVLSASANENAWNNPSELELDNNILRVSFEGIWSRFNYSKMCNEVEDRVTHFRVVKPATKYPRRKFEVCYCHSNSLSSMYLSENKSIFFIDSPTITLNGTFVVMSELWSFLCHKQHFNFTTKVKPFKVCSLNKQLSVSVWWGEGVFPWLACRVPRLQFVKCTMWIKPGAFLFKVKEGVKKSVCAFV